MRARGTDRNGFSGSAPAADAPAPGKRTLTEALPMHPPAATGGERVAQLKGERAQSPVGPDMDAVHDRLVHSAGAPLDPQLAGPMGIELGHDLGGVKVHDSAVSHQITAEMGARAMTVGADVYFGRGQYQPTTETGRELIGHELTHVVQQSQGRTRGLDAKPEKEDGSRSALEAEADARGKRAADAVKAADVDWDHVDTARLKDKIKSIEAAGGDVPVVKRPGDRNHPLLVELARQLPRATAAKTGPAQLGRDTSYYPWPFDGTVYNRVEVTGLPTFLIHHDDGSSGVTYHMHPGHLNAVTSGENSRREGNFGVDIQGATKKHYTYETYKAATWDAQVQKETGATPGSRVTVRMYNDAFSNIEASDWFDVAPPPFVTPMGGPSEFHDTNSKVPFVVPTGVETTLSVSQFSSLSSGYTLTRSAVDSTTIQKSIKLGLTAEHDFKKPGPDGPQKVGEIGAEFGWGQATSQTISKGVSGMTSQLSSVKKDVTTGRTIKGTKDRNHVYLYPVWMAQSVLVTAYPYDPMTGEVLGKGPRTFYGNYLTIDRIQDLPAKEDGTIDPGAGNDAAIAAETKRLDDLKKPQEVGDGVQIALDREHEMVKDFDKQRLKALYKPGLQTVEDTMAADVHNDFSATDSSGLAASKTTDWNLSAGGSFMGLGGKFGISEAETKAQEFGDAVAKSGTKGSGSSVTVKMQIEGPSEAEMATRFVQVALIPMYRERLYKYRLWLDDKKTWSGWLPQRARSRQVMPAPAVSRQLVTQGSDMKPVAAEVHDERGALLKPSADQLSTGDKVEELRKLYMKETDAGRRKDIGDQIEKLLTGVSPQLEDLVRKAHPTLEAVDKKRNLWKITVNGKPCYSTLESLLDFTAPPAAVTDISQRVAIHDSTAADGTRIKTTQGLGGTSAQPRVNPYPADVDLYESVKVTGKDADATSRALAASIAKSIHTALEPVPGKQPLIFQHMTCGIYPPDAVKPRAGSIAAWRIADIDRGYLPYTSNQGDAQLTLAQAIANPNPEYVVNTFWKGPIDGKGTYGEFTRVINFQALDQAGKKLFETPQQGQAYQEVDLDLPAAHDGDRVVLMRKLSEDIQSRVKAGDWMKACKRAYTLARLTDNFRGVEELQSILNSDHAHVVQAFKQVNIFWDEVVKPGGLNSSMDSDTAQAQADLHEARIADVDKKLGAVWHDEIRNIKARKLGIAGNKGLYGALKYKVIQPLEEKAKDDAAFDKRARAALGKLGYLN